MNDLPAGRELFRTLLRVVAFAFALFLIYRFLEGIATVVLSLAIGALLAVAVSGPVEALHRRKVSRSLATALVFLGGAGVVGLGVYLFTTLFAEQVYDFFSTLPSATASLADRGEGLLERLGVPLPGGEVSPSSVADPARRILGGAVGIFEGAASVLVGLVVVLFLAFYLASNPEPVVSWVVRLFPMRHRPRAREVLGAVRSSLLGWIKGQLAAMAVIGTLSTIAFFLIGLPGALFLGLLAGLLSFVPYLGPVAAFVPPFLLAFTVDLTTVVLVTVAYLAVQTAESYLITPLIMEKVASLHPAAVIAGVTVLGTAFGVLGALLAVPAVVAIGTLVRELWFKPMEEASPTTVDEGETTEVRGNDLPAKS
jgi:predicted PurR-regulated permease PerM